MAKKDLIPLNKRPPEERAAIQRKATERSKEVRAQRREMKEAMKMLLELPAIDSKTKRDLIRKGFDPKTISNMDILIHSLWRQAANGNVYALKEVRNLIGQDDSARITKIKEEEWELKKQLLLS